MGNAYFEENTKIRRVLAHVTHDFDVSHPPFGEAYSKG